MSHLTLDGLQITGLTDIRNFDVPLTTLLPDADDAEVAAIPWLKTQDYSDGTLHLTIRSWLLRVRDRVILIDTCVGEHKSRPAWPDWDQRRQTGWIAALAAEGLTPDDVDLVMCTHLHADHVGWNTRLDNGRWVPTFRNARYVCGTQEYDYWRVEAERAMDRHGSFADSVLPLVEAGAMDLVDDGWELGPGLTLATAPGHTPGHMCIHASHGPGAVFCGDAIHSPVQLAHPDWSSAFCSDPEQSRQTRRTLLEGVADKGLLLIPAHFQDPGWTALARDGQSFQPLARVV